MKATKKEIYQLLGVAKILDNLWDNAHYSMGEKACERLKIELVYYFGKEWYHDMYKFIEEVEGKKYHERELVKTLKELKLK